MDIVEMKPHASLGKVRNEISLSLSVGHWPGVSLELEYQNNLLYLLIELL